jgi:hypothetical protein
MFAFGVAMNRLLLLLVRYLIAVLSLLSFALPEQAEKAMRSVESDSSPEIERLVNTFGGEWKVVENFERSGFFPNGGARKELRE